MKKNIRMIPLDRIGIGTGFWKNYMEIVRTSMIPYQWEVLNDRMPDTEPSYCISNFRRAAGLEEGPFRGFPFQDTDLYKWLEAVAYTLATHPDRALEEIADGAIDLIAAAQAEDGYLDTKYIIEGLENRFTNIMDNHELYCLGHMTEAAVAYYQATGKRKFLDCAIRYADCVDAHFGPEEGKIKGYPGHEIAEMALMRLYEVTGEERHLKLAKFFIDERGKQPRFFAHEPARKERGYSWGGTVLEDKYFQADVPVRQQEKAEGHAVRAVYLYSGMADVAAETEDEELLQACERLWNNIVTKQMYVTGSIGASEYGESFTFDYDLPNDTPYAETCAAIGLVFFARRMFEITGDSRYIDVMEQCLYNGVISGMTLDGKRFFYVNPLEVQPEACEKDGHKQHIKAERQKWFSCACCPPNLARLIASIGGYAFERSEDTVFINLFTSADIKLSDRKDATTLHVTTAYPNNGNISMSIETKERQKFRLAIRIPGWCRNWTAYVNGAPVAEASGNAGFVGADAGDTASVNVSFEKGYIYLEKEWENSDFVEISIDIDTKLVSANPRVRSDIGKAAVKRGPVVYCLEEADNGDQLQELYIKADTKFTKENITLVAEGARISESDWGEDMLYKPYSKPEFKDTKLTFIPYYAWANRGVGEMLVWVHVKES